MGTFEIGDGGRKGRRDVLCNLSQCRDMGEASGWPIFCGDKHDVTED